MRRSLFFFFSFPFFYLFSLFSVSCAIKTIHKNPFIKEKNLVSDSSNKLALPIEDQNTNSHLKDEALLNENLSTEQEEAFSSHKTLSREQVSFLEGRDFFHQASFHLAYQKFLFVIESRLSEKALKEEAFLGAIYSLKKMKLYQESLKMTERALQLRNLSEEKEIQLYELRFSLLSELGFYLEAVHVAQFLFERLEMDEKRHSYRLKSLEYLESYLGEEDLKNVIRSYRLKPLHAYAYFHLASIYVKKNLRRARIYFERVSRLLPGSSLAEQASKWIERMKNQGKVEPYNIGVILPLSGGHASLSQKILNGLQLGLGIYGENPGSHFQLVISDSFESSDVASDSVEKLLSEHKVIAIVGSLLSRTAEFVAQKANELGIPSISLSQRLHLTRVGPYVFRHAFTSEMEMNLLVQILMQEKGFKNFAVLFPNDGYGVQYTNLFWDKVKALGGHITGAQSYKPGETDFKNPVERLVGLYYLEDREEEFRGLVEEWIEKQKGINFRKMPPMDLLPPLVNFDVLFIPDGVKAVGQIAPMLAYYEVENVTLVGTNAWNKSALIRRGQKHVEGALFLDAQFDFTKTTRARQFLRSYQKTFGDNPNMLSVRSYDVARILRHFIEEGEKTRVGLKERLKELKDFPGLFGHLHMTDKREIFQPTSLFTVSKGEIKSLKR